MVAKCKCVWPEPDNNIRHAKDQHILNDISYTPKHIHSLHLLCWFPDRGCYFQRDRELSVTFIACYFVPDFEMYFFLDQKEDQLIAFLLRRPLLLIETTRYIHHNILLGQTKDWQILLSCLFMLKRLNMYVDCLNNT